MNEEIRRRVAAVCRELGWRYTSSPTDRTPWSVVRIYSGRRVHAVDDREFVEVNFGCDIPEDLYDILGPLSYRVDRIQRALRAAEVAEKHGLIGWSHPKRHNAGRLFFRLED